MGRGRVPEERRRGEKGSLREEIKTQRARGTIKKKEGE